MSGQRFKIRFEVVGLNGSVLHSDVLNGRPPKAVRSLAVFLVSELGVNPLAMIAGLGEAVVAVSMVPDEKWKAARKKHELEGM